MKRKVVLIVQARMGSTRLPGKSMYDLAGRPMITRIIQRLKKCKMVNEIVLAIPKSEQNFCLIKQAYQNNIKFFRGHEDDLVQRFYKAASLFKARTIVRFPADNPVPEPSEIDRIIKFHFLWSKRGFTSNISQIKGSGYPDGIGAEVFEFESLKYFYRKNKSKLKKEHVHLNYYNYVTGLSNYKKFPVRTIKCPKNFRRPDIVLDVNYKKQYKMFEKLYNDLYKNNPNFNINDVIKWYDSNIITKEN